MPVMIEDMDAEEVPEMREELVPVAQPGGAMSEAERRRITQHIALRAERALRWEAD